MSLSGYVASETVRYGKIDSCGIVLDLQTQKYSVLDDSATAIWEILTDDLDVDDCIAQWTCDFEVTNDEIMRTIDAFRTECLNVGWLSSKTLTSQDQLVRRTGSFRSLGRRLPARVVAFLALASTALSLRFKGFSKTYGCRREVFIASPTSLPPLQLIAQAFLEVENFFFLKRAPNDCLVRSLALFRYLCWRGVPATHVIGIRRVPFAAHAWVEAAGEAVLEPSPQGFSTLATLTAISE